MVTPTTVYGFTGGPGVGNAKQGPGEAQQALGEAKQGLGKAKQGLGDAKQGQGVTGKARAQQSRALATTIKAFRLKALEDGMDDDVFGPKRRGQIAFLVKFGKARHGHGKQNRVWAQHNSSFE